MLLSPWIYNTLIVVIVVNDVGISMIVGYISSILLTKVIIIHRIIIKYWIVNELLLLFIRLLLLLLYMIWIEASLSNLSPSTTPLLTIPIPLFDNEDAGINLEFCCYCISDKLTIRGWYIWIFISWLVNRFYSLVSF